MPASPRAPGAVPTFFATAAAFRQWLELHAAEATELLVGFHKVDSGRPSMSWSESVDEALCFGWIDGVRKRIDDHSYSIRFTHRRASSIWSAINIAKFEQLQSEGRMTPAGAQAFAHRKEHKSAIYSYEQEESAELSAQELREFRRNKQAWQFFEAAPPGYKKQMLHRIVSARKPETRAARLAKLVQASAAGQRLL
jgi:uncharacterized protein YdeI (YjbR/CyaY-like superfamily)